MPRPWIPFPEELRPKLPTIVGNVDYQTLRQRLEEIDALLRESGVERMFVDRALELWSAGANRKPTVREELKYQERSRRALRCTVLRTLLQLDYRDFSCQLAGNPLYQWFCRIDALDQVCVPSKSELHRFAHWLPIAEMRAIADGLLRRAAEQPQAMRLRQGLDLEACLLDSTCLKANIHFPVDWVLLRDGVRTLMKATLLIREAGLRGRMESPETFMCRMNQLCMAMSQQSRRAGSKKGRKRVLRQMKRIVRSVRAHAQRHRQLLDEHWQRTDWTRAQAEQILRRIDGVLDLLPRACKQAHERIIGERLVDNADKILSLYDTDVRVIVRGKSGAEVEFGNTVLLAENRQGIILDYALFRESAPADSQLVESCLERIKTATGKPVGAVVSDRGFASKSNSRRFRGAGIYDASCPRDPGHLRERMKEVRFARLQRRRAQTEARIAILKRQFLGTPPRAKGFAHRELALAWAVLTHNLWMFARLRKVKKRRAAAPLRQAA